MITEISKLDTFRKELYSLFPKRRDAIMNLLDALTSYGHRCTSVVQLSQADCFKRQYSSITDAIADGLPDARWNDMMKLIYSYANKEKSPNRFLLDCTSQPRPYANKLIDRAITHLPNPAPGNKPICVGHQYSLLALLPSDAKNKHWLVPISFKRIESSAKGNEEGMKQMVGCIKTLDLTEETNISIGDTLYGTEDCRITASTQDNLIHIFRLNGKRNVYAEPTSFSEKGRKKEYGSKMVLNDENSHCPCDQETEIVWMSRKGKEYKVKIKSWRNMLLRGSRKYRSSQYPINIIQVKVVDLAGRTIFKRPLWLGIFGKKRNEVNLIEAYQNYVSRYDIEHFFRYGKQKLLLHAYQTADTEHEELWWKFSLLAYMQLYLAKSVVTAIPQPWERYLPEYKNQDEKQTITTPSQTQRGFTKLLKEIGTPVNKCIARGKPCGRMPGESGVKKVDQPIMFKSQKKSPSSPEDILSGFGKKANDSNPQKIDELIKVIKTILIQNHIPAEQLAKKLLDDS